jgi:hypothetical protein
LPPSAPADVVHPHDRRLYPRGPAVQGLGAGDAAVPSAPRCEVDRSAENQAFLVEGVNGVETLKSMAVEAQLLFAGIVVISQASSWLQ